MNFRGKEWKRDCNHYSLVGTNVRVYQWNTGANANFMVEVLGRKPWEQSTYTIPGKGACARDTAIAKALELAKE